MEVDTISNSWQLGSFDFVDESLTLCEGLDLNNERYLFRKPFVIVSSNPPLSGLHPGSRLWRFWHTETRFRKGEIRRQKTRYSCPGTWFSRDSRVIRSYYDPICSSLFPPLVDHLVTQHFWTQSLKSVESPRSTIFRVNIDKSPVFDVS